MQRLLPLLAVVAFALLGGCSAPPILSERTVPISASLGYAQVNVVLEAGQAVQWEWSVLEGENVLFTVHTREPYRVHEVRTAAHSIGSFEAPAAGSYALYWEREAGERLTLRYRVAGDGHLDPSRPPVPP